MDFHVLRCVGCFIAMFVFEMIAAYLEPESLGYNICMIISVVMLVLLVAMQLIHKNDGSATGNDVN